jgi:tRNA dimethylallyltransferase
MGPTASGKSGLSMALRELASIEIISVDSALVYRGMDIGTAKPGFAETTLVPHHLIDIIDPEEPYSAARFASDAKALIADIRRRHRVPVLVGGTMLYFRALQQGIDAMPSADQTVRAEIEQEAQRDGWPAMHRLLATFDPDSAARLAPADAQRIQRAIEVYRLSGVSLSSWHQRQSAASTSSDFFNLALIPADRAALHARIAERFDRMLDAGLLDEVATLLKRPALKRDAPSLRAVGYRQAVELLLGEIDAPTMRERALAATRQLAKHQLTWLRSTHKDFVIDTMQDDAPQRFLAAARQVLQPS